MKIYRIILVISLLFILMVNIGLIFANENLTCSYNEYSNDTSVDSGLTYCFDGNIASSQNSKTIHVEPDKENPNQMVKPTIQPAIDIANPGDTIVLNGNFAHCHFLINKTLNIIAYNATLGPCPLYQTEDAGSLGVFYITQGGSGSVISGATFKNNARAVTPFSFLIRDASNVTINDCTIDYPEDTNHKYQSIVIENSTNIDLSNLIVGNSIDGIKIIDSSNINIKECNISNNDNQAISIIGNSSNINIFNNSITGNKKYALEVLSANYVNVINNLIKDNGLNNYDSGSGIYVNTNITKLVVKGNVFLSNGLHAIMYDYRTRNLNDDYGADELTDVDNNYFEGHDSMVLHHRIYVERDYGTLKYDAENDVFGDIGVGTYAEGKSYVYMKHALMYKDVPCGFTYIAPQIPWAMEANGNGGKYNLSLKLSIAQIKKGVYKLSIIDDEGNVAADFSGFNMTFFLNDCNTLEPKTNDVYKKVSVQNGVATADFRDVYASFKSSGNLITAVFPGISDKVAYNLNIKLNISDSDIPIDSSTKIISSKLTTYPLSDSYLSAKLVDSKGHAIANQKVTFKFNGKTYTAKTNSLGVAKVKVSLSSKKTYPVTLTYAGNDDYKSSKATSQIVVKTGSKKTKITASNIKIKRNKKKTYQLKLTNSAGNALNNQKVIVKLNGKSYILKTNKKGIAKLSVKISKAKKYKISMRFLGNSKYKACSKATMLTITK